jgi:general secretion pathway protein D
MMQLRALCVSVALLALPVSAAPSPQARGPQAQGQGQGPVPTIQKQGDFYVLNFSEDREDAPDLEYFVKLCQQATGQNFTYLDDTQTQLKGKKIRLFGTKRIPVEDFYRFFQIMMFIHDFVAVEVGPPHLSVVVIQALNTPQQRGGIRQKTTYVLPEELEDYADQPAVLITTVLHLPNTDTRQLPATLRPLLADQQTQSLVSVGNTNSIILQGFGSQVAALARLLHIVDRESAVEEEEGPLFDTIPLEFAAAEEVADLLDQLLEARSSGTRGVRPQQQQAEGVAGRLRPGSDLEPEVLVDDRTNSLIVMALREDMPNIKELVARLDVDVVEPERNYHIYSLENVQAEDISEVLDDFLSDAARLTESGTGTGGRAQQSTTASRRQNEVVVVPDPATNSLLIAASKTRYEEILELLRQLDRRQDQVLIETALIELTGSDMLDVGFELAGADIPGADEDGQFGITSFGLSTVDDLQGNDGIPDTRVPTIGTGITAGIIDGGDFNLPFLLRFVAEEDNANVLSVPSILVNNNGSATVRTVDEQPTTQVTAQGQGQTQENFSGYQEAGIELSISPSISASRYLRLGVTLLVSNFTGAFQGNIPPPRITRELRTTVNVPDGDTMVIGGIRTPTTARRSTSS